MDYRVTLKHQWSKSGRGKRWIVVLLSATFISLIYAARNVVGSVSAGRPIDWAWQVGYQFLYWYVWAAFTPLILWVAGSFDLEHASRRRVAPLLAMGFLIAPLQAAIEYGLALTIESLRHATGEELSYRTQQFGRGILLESFTNIIIYILIVAGHYSYEYYRRYRERQLRSAELEGRLAQAELQNLKMQLQPHFLFNTLHTISVLMMRDAGAANRMLVRLGDLLRLSLDHVGSQEVSLKQELEFLNGYLEIEQARFQDRLKINRRIDPVTLDAVVPTLLLQPLVENAIRHGISKRLGTGAVEIRSKHINSSLHLEIQDNGPGLGPGAPAPPKGLGLANTRARLQQLYGSQHQFELKDAPAGGLVVSILIPCGNNGIGLASAREFWADGAKFDIFRRSRQILDQDAAGLGDDFACTNNLRKGIRHARYIEKGQNPHARKQSDRSADRKGRSGKLVYEMCADCASGNSLHGLVRRADAPGVAR